MVDETQAVSTTSAEAVPDSLTVPSDKSAPAKPEWWALLDAADKKELAKHPIVAGLAGTMHERQLKNTVERTRNETAAERDAYWAAKLEEDRLETLRKNYPSDYADEVGRKKEAEITAKMQADRAIADLQRASYELAVELELDEDDLKPLQNKVYPGTAQEGFRAHVKELNAIALAKNAKGQVEKEMTDWKKQVEAAARAAALAEINGSEPSPDVGGGRAPAAPRGAKALESQSDYQKLGKTPAERYAAVMGSR